MYVRKSHRKKLAPPLMQFWLSYHEKEDCLHGGCSAHQRHGLRWCPRGASLFHVSTLCHYWSLASRWGLSQLRAKYGIRGEGRLENAFARERGSTYLGSGALAGLAAYSSAVCIDDFDDDFDATGIFDW